MRILIISLLFSMSAMANEYVQKKGSCVITADVQDYFNPARKLPFSLNLKYSFAYLQNTGALVATNFKSSTESHNTSPAWAEVLVESIEKNINIDSTYTGVTRANFDLTKAQLNALLVYLGSYRAQDLLGAFPRLSYNIQIPGVGKEQVHTDTDYGLSFHIYTVCDFDGASTPDDNGPVPPTPPTQDMAHVCTYHLETPKGRFLEAFSTRSRRMDWACNASKNRCIERAREVRGIQHCHKRNTFL